MIPTTKRACWRRLAQRSSSRSFNQLIAPHVDNTIENHDAARSPSRLPARDNKNRPASVASTTLLRLRTAGQSQSVLASQLFARMLDHWCRHDLDRLLQRAVGACPAVKLGKRDKKRFSILRTCEQDGWRRAQVHHVFDPTSAR